jgi:hypothetical protein
MLKIDTNKLMLNMDLNPSLWNEEPNANHLNKLELLYNCYNLFIFVDNIF